MSRCTSQRLSPLSLAARFVAARLGYVVLYRNTNALLIAR